MLTTRPGQLDQPEDHPGYIVEFSTGNDRIHGTFVSPGLREAGFSCIDMGIEVLGSQGGHFNDYAAARAARASLAAAFHKEGWTADTAALISIASAVRAELGLAA